MKLKFNLFVNLGVVALVAAPGAHAWGAAGQPGFIPLKASVTV
jgi:hypothetical protein